MSIRRVLVTGGAGFIGSAVVRRLVNEGFDVINVDKLTYSGSLESLHSVDGAPNYRFHRTDICDQAAIASVLSVEKPDVIMHLAAETHVDRSIDGPAEFIETNIIGTFRLLNAALSYWRQLNEGRQSTFRFHHISTDEVFGDLEFNERPFTEETPYNPSSPYSASKAAADHLVRAWHRTYGLPIILSNCSNNYGLFQFPEKLIPLTIINALEGKRLPVYGRGENVRDWLYVEDHARALELIATHGKIGENYNVGGLSERSNLEVVQTICDVLDAKSPLANGGSRRNLIEFVPDRPGHDLRYAIDCSKIRRELGWNPADTFESGLANTIQWYLDNEWWWRPIREDRYAGERLGMAS